MKQPSRYLFFILFFVAIGGVLYGYDLGVISGALLFIRKTIALTQLDIEITVAAVFTGGLLGTLAAGPMADRYGRRVTMLFASLIFLAGIVIILFAVSFIQLLTARLMLGAGVGFIAVIVPIYAAELSPREKRGHYIAAFQLLLTVGILLAYSVDYLFLPSGNWRAMFAVAAIPAIIFALGIGLLPESPRWLIAQGKNKLAKKILARVHNKDVVDIEFAEIKHSLTNSTLIWKDLLHKTLLFPLIVVVTIAMLNQLIGMSAILQYAPTIFDHSGLSNKNISMLSSIGIGIVNFVFTIISMLLVDKVGRKPLLTIGLMGLITADSFLGFSQYMLGSYHPHFNLTIMGLFFAIAFYALGPGTIIWIAMSELLPTHARGKGMSLAIFFNSLSSTVIASVFLKLDDLIGLSGIYFLFAIFGLCYLAVAIFFIPETRGLSLEQIEDKVNAKHHFAQQDSSASRVTNEN